MERSAALVALALAGLLTGCADDVGAPVLSPVASAPVPTSQAPSSPTATAAPTSPATPPRTDEDGGTAPAFRADVRPDVQEETSGGPLSVREVRVAAHDGYDRVVFELAGRRPGRAGWRVDYVDEPTAQGSGDPVAVEGNAVLRVLVLGTGLPTDTGVTEVVADPALPADLAVVEDVVLGAVFEGQYQAFIGSASRAPFRVFRLGDPERVVVDVSTS